MHSLSARVTATLRPVLLLFVLGLGCIFDSSDDEPFLTLTVEIDPAGTGSGRVEGGTELSCPIDCVDQFQAQETMFFTAVPNPGSAFVSWSGDCGGSNPNYQLTSATDATCIARFDAGQTHTLTVTIDPQGTGEGDVTGAGIDCGASGGTDCTEVLLLGTDAELTATPTVGTFTTWGGDCAAFGNTPDITLAIDGDKNCTARFDDVQTGGILIPAGEFTFTYRVEAMGVDAPFIFVQGFDNPEGTRVDFTDPDNPTSPQGAEFFGCLGARTGNIFFIPHAPYNQDVFFSTAVTTECGSITPTGGGFTQAINFFYEPGGADIWGTDWLSVSDFENGNLKKLSVTNPPAVGVTIPLSPAERSCPFSQVVEGDVAYVVGREGAVGTSTENCDNWRGMWFVDLATNTVIDFLPFGIKPRDVEYGSNNVLYVSDFDGDKIYVIDPTTRAITRSIDTGDGPTGIAVSPAGNRLYVANWNANEVEVIDLSTDQRVDVAPSGGVQPVDVVLAGNTLVVLNFGNPTTATGAVIKLFGVQ